MKKVCLIGYTLALKDFLCFIIDNSDFKTNSTIDALVQFTENLRSASERGNVLFFLGSEESF